MEIHKSRGESKTSLSASLYIHLDLFRSHPSKCSFLAWHFVLEGENAAGETDVTVNRTGVIPVCLHCQTIVILIVTVILILIVTVILILIVTVICYCYGFRFSTLNQKYILIPFLLLCSTDKIWKEILK